MATIKKPRKVASNPNLGAKRKTGKKKNPQAAARRTKHRHSRNPRAGSWKDLIIGVLTGLGSAIATRNIPQMLLADKNEGVTGYLANAAVTAACAIGADHFISTSAGFAAVVGGGGIIADRILTDKVAPIGRYLALKGIGDASSLVGLKGIRQGLYITRDANGDPIIPQQYTDAALDAFDRRQVAQAPAPQMQGTQRSRFASRTS